MPVLCTKVSQNGLKRGRVGDSTVSMLDLHVQMAVRVSVHVCTEVITI